MRRALLVTSQIVAAALIGLSVGFLWTAARPGGDRGASPANAIEVAATVEPAVHAFGEPVVATVAVVVDSDAVDPASVTVDAEFGSYEPAGPLTIERRDAGAVSTLRYRYPLRCLGEGCDPVGARQSIEFPLGRIGYLYRETSRRAFVELDWNAFQVTGRVNDTAVERIDWRASTARLPEPSYRVEPVRLAVGLLLIAMAIAAAAAWLAWRFLRPEPVTADDDETVRRLSPLEQALAIAGAATEEGNPAERKRALERVARELVGIGEPSLAADARALAWSPNGSHAVDLDDLRRRVADVTARLERA